MESTSMSQFLALFQSLQTVKTMDDLEEIIRHLRQLVAVQPTMLLSNEMRQYLGIGLKHEMSVFNEFVLDQLSNSIITDSNQQQRTNSISMISDPIILESLVLLISDIEKSSASEKVIQLFLKIANWEEGRKLLFSDVLVKQFQSVVAKKQDETITFRILTLYVSILKQNATQQTLSSIIKTGFLSTLISTFTESKDDVLKQLNALDLLGQLAETSIGFEYLEKQGVLRSLFSILNSNDPMLRSLLLPPLIGLFGELTLYGSSHISRLQSLGFFSYLSKEFENEETNVDMKRAMLTAIGKLSSSVLGLEISSKEKLFEKFYSELEGERLRLDVLNGLTFILQRWSRNGQTDQSLLRTALGFSIDNDVNTERSDLSVVLRLYIHSPFIQLKMNALRCISELSKFVWAAKIILTDDEFVPFIVDRSNEQTKEGKEFKFAIVEGLLLSISKDSTIANTDQKLALQVYFKQGTFYSKGEYTVEMDTKA